MGRDERLFMCADRLRTIKRLYSCSVGWRTGALPLLLCNDYCYLILDQLQWLHSSRIVGVSHTVSHSAGNYIFSLLRSLSDSLFNGDQ